jgi:hypothetical protein
VWIADYHCHANTDSNRDEGNSNATTITTVAVVVEMAMDQGYLTDTVPSPSQGEQLFA